MRKLFFFYFSKKTVEPFHLLGYGIKTAGILAVLGLSNYVMTFLEHASIFLSFEQNC